MKAEEFNVGDWVVKKDDDTFHKGSIWDIPFQIAKLHPVNARSDDFYCYNEKGNNNYLSNFRHCLPHEIPDYTPSPDTYSYLTPILKKLKIK